jgi:hypothetical protein
MANDQREIRARDWIAALSGIPTRFAGSYSERVSAERVGQWMRELGLSEVSFEPVASRPRTGWALALHAGIALLGFWFGGFLGVVLTVLVAWSFQREHSGGSMLLSRFGERDRPRRRDRRRATRHSLRPHRRATGRLALLSAARRLLLAA